MKNILKNIQITFLLFVAVSFSFAGCDKKQEAQPPQTQPGNKPAPVTLPVQQQVSTANLPPSTENRINFADYKDPFKPYITDPKKASSVKRNRLGQALPILNFEVSQFKVSGIIVGLNENSAMILDPTGKPYIVKAGMEIGRNEGRITKVAAGYIEIFEQYRDESGKLIKKTIRLTLPKKD